MTGRLYGPIPPGNYWKHRIKAGDTLSAIAAAYRGDPLDIEPIWQSNPMLDYTNDLSDHVGQWIYIPYVASVEATVEAGDAIKELIRNRA